MPCLEITMPELSPDTKEELTIRLTDAFGKATGFPTEIFGIHFNEYRPGNAASGGKICDPNKGRPYLHFLLYIPRLTYSQKQKVVEGFTKSFTDCLDKPEWKPVVHICEHPYDNVGVDGKLLCDAYEELGKREFYYKLPRE